MKYDLTNDDIRAIFDLAHREWLDDCGYKPSERHLVVISYFRAVTSFLTAKGYTIEKPKKEPNKG